MDGTEAMLHLDAEVGKHLTGRNQPKECSGRDFKILQIVLNAPPMRALECLTCHEQYTEVEGLLVDGILAVEDESPTEPYSVQFFYRYRMHITNSSRSRLMHFKTEIPARKFFLEVSERIVRTFWRPSANEILTGIEIRLFRKNERIDSRELPI